MHTAPAAPLGAEDSQFLKWLTTGSANATNYNMLLFRTFNREMGAPNANGDNLAPLLRDKLMPVRMWWLKHAPGALKMFRRGLEHKKFGAPGVLNFVDARTSWFDKAVTEALQKGIQQVVVVAAGFDTRAYRFGGQYKGVSFFEVDLPHASLKKQQLVSELLLPESSFPRPTFLAADLSVTPLDAVLLSASASAHNPHATAAAPATATAHSAGTPDAATTLATATASAAPASATAAAAAAGTGSGPCPGVFDPSKPTLFTVEGLIYYLPSSAVQQLFEAMLRVAAPGSRVAFDFLHQEVLDGSVPAPPAYKVTAASVANKGEPFVSGIGNSRAALQAFLDSSSAAGAAAATAATDAATADSATITETATEAATEAATEKGSEGSGPAAAAAPAVAAGSGSSARLSWRLQDFLGPADVVKQHLPHLTWDDALPPILSFYSYATAEVV